MDELRPIDPFIRPDNSFVFDNSYILKTTASKLLLQRIVLPELERLDITTRKFHPIKLNEEIFLGGKKVSASKKHAGKKVEKKASTKKSTVTTVTKKATITFADENKKKQKPKKHVIPTEKDVIKMLEKSEFSAPVPPVYQPVLAKNADGPTIPSIYNNKK
jgi:hypothetical protein